MQSDRIVEQLAAVDASAGFAGGSGSSEVAAAIQDACASVDCSPDQLPALLSQVRGEQSRDKPQVGPLYSLPGLGLYCRTASSAALPTIWPGYSTYTASVLPGR